MQTTETYLIRRQLEIAAAKLEGPSPRPQEAWEEIHRALKTLDRLEEPEA